LADFGFSKHFSSQSLGFTSTGWGTNGYMAPEFLLPADDKIAYNCKADIWSLGCILYELAVGKHLFEDNYYVMRYKDTGVRPEITFDESYCDDDKEHIRNAFNRMLSLDSRARPEAKSLVEEFSSNYARTTLMPPQSIHIYEEFSTTSLTTMMARTELTTTHERMGVIQISHQGVQLPVDIEQRKSLVLSEITQDPSSFWSRHALSTLFTSNSDDIEGAITVCVQWLERFPGTPSIIMELINLYVFQGNYIEAVKYSLEVVRMDLNVILNALSTPKSHVIRSVLPGLEEKERSLQLFAPEILFAN
jgi:serine/threonine protein kinase